MLIQREESLIWMSCMPKLPAFFQEVETLNTKSRRNMAIKFKIGFAIAEERRGDRPSVPSAPDSDDDVQHPPATELALINCTAAEAQRAHEHEQRRLLHAAGQLAFKVQSCGKCQCKGES